MFQWTTNYEFSAPSGAAAANISPSGVAGANSRWVQVHPGETAACVLTCVVIPTPGAVADYEVDIGVGPTGSATPIATVKGWQRFIAVYGHGRHEIPIGIDAIPSGTPITARLRKTGTDTTAWGVAVQYLKKPIVGNLQVTAKPLKVAPSALGVAAPSTSGVWTFGAWVQVLGPAPSGGVTIAALVMSSPLTSEAFELQLGKGIAPSGAVLTTVKGQMAASTAAYPGRHAFKNPVRGVSGGEGIVTRWRRATSGTQGISVGIEYYEEPL